MCGDRPGTQITPAAETVTAGKQQLTSHVQDNRPQHTTQPKPYGRGPSGDHHPATHQIRQRNRRPPALSPGQELRERRTSRNGWSARQAMIGDHTTSHSPTSKSGGRALNAATCATTAHTGPASPSWTFSQLTITMITWPRRTATTMTTTSASTHSEP